MKEYSILQLLLFFYIYGFLGWVYESILVSVESKKLVNRGFMKGPILPIYGFGATVILFSTKPFTDYPAAVFFVGMINSAILEYISGYLLEKIFKIRYWDYRGRFGNIRGYICLLSVVLWGLFSLFTVYFLHEYVTAFIDLFPFWIVYIIMFVVAIVFAIDLSISFKTAYDIKNIHSEMTKLYNELIAGNNEINEKLEKYRKAFEEAAAKFNERKAVIKKGNPTAKMSIKFHSVIEEIRKHINQN